MGGRGLQGDVVDCRDEALESLRGRVCLLMAVDAQQHDVMASMALHVHWKVLPIAIWDDPAVAPPGFSLLLWLMHV